MNWLFKYAGSDVRGADVFWGLRLHVDQFATVLGNFNLWLRNLNRADDFSFLGGEILD